DTDPENGAALLLQSRAFLAEDDYSRAVLTLRNLLHQQPSSRAGMVLLVQAHMMAKEPGLAIEVLQRLIEIDPTNDRALLLLASLLTRRGDLGEAVPLLDRVLDRGPDNGVALAAKFQILLARGAWGQAEAVAQNVRALEGGAVLGHALQGRLYQRLGQFSDAAAEFRAALAIDGNHQAALTGLIQSYLALNRAADAEKFLHDRLADTPDDALVHKLLGDVQQQRPGESKAAADAYRRAIALRPSWPEPYLRLALLHRQSGEADKMITVLERGLANAPGDEALTAALAGGYRTTDDSLGAIEAYENMIARSDESVAVANNLVALVSDYDFDKQASLSMAEMLSEPFVKARQPRLLDTLGWVHYRLGNYEQAIDYLEKALSSGGDRPQVRYHLGMVYLELGAAERARQELELAVQSDVNFPGLGKARQALAEL
ncbi:MAG TPA: tetratricopeptide repeat protein, partial [Kiloniellaceae bacterium]|nr:tetratricopeptide repeat protein [Kiloniellaceae bacterium]